MISRRAASQAIMIPRLGRRSTSAPAGSAITANARVAAALRRPTSNVLAASRTTAVSGSASWVTAEPTSLTVWPPPQQQELTLPPRTAGRVLIRHRLLPSPAPPGRAEVGRQLVHQRVGPLVDDLPGRMAQVPVRDLPRPLLERHHRVPAGHHRPHLGVVERDRVGLVPRSE